MKSRNTLIFIAIIMISLAGISSLFPKEGIDIGVRKLYFPTIEDIINSNNNSSSKALEHLHALEEELRLQRYSDSVYADSLRVETLFTDSLTQYITFFEKSSTRIYMPDNDHDFLNDLFADLDSCKDKGKIIRILHYGGSQIEGDRISGYLRQHLQEKFGGTGPGLLPAVQPIQSNSMEQSSLGSIQRFTVAGNFKNSASHNRYGVLGQIGAVNGECNITVTSRRNTFEHVRRFQKIRLFSSSDSLFTAQLSLPGKEPLEANTIDNNSSVVKYTWNLPTQVNTFSLHVSGEGEIYGIAVDGSSGVAVDNIPFRGSAGTFFSSMDRQIMSAMFKHLNTRLIILQFGSNAVPSISSEKDIEVYCSTLVKQINWIKNCCPEAKILLIGPPDMSTTIDGERTSYPLLESLVESMKEIAVQNGAAFWNIYQVMGGKNSMIEWVRHSPALAATDYTHFSSKGVERISSILCETLMVYYDYYRFITNIESLTCEEIPSSDY